MPIDYKKLLPSNLRETRWGEFMEAIQAVLDDIKTNKINIIEDQFNIDEMVLAQINNMRDMLGYQFLNFGEGYTNTTRYLQRQLLTIINRVLNKNSLKAYQSNFYIYNLIADIFPMTYSSVTDTLTPVTDFWTWDESEVYIIDKLDLGSDRILYYDDLSNPVYADDPLNWGLSAQTLDTDSWPTLDQKTINDSLTRHIIIPYKFVDVENNTYFLTENTLTSFFEDINFTKRATELAYFEPICTINCSGVVGFSGAFDSDMITKEYYYSYDETYSGIVESYFYGSTDLSLIGLSGVAQIQFGSGSHDIINGSISGVATPIITSGVINGIINATDTVEVSVTTPTNFNVRRKISQQCVFANYSELALIDANSGIVMYSKFPEITYLTDKTKFYGNVQIDINLI